MGSDAYATGQALFALRESRASAPGDRAYRKGIEFLLRTQIEDGIGALSGASPRSVNPTLERVEEGTTPRTKMATSTP